jgi:hypothetical protein
LTPKLYGWRLNKSMRYTWIHAINEPRNFSYYLGRFMSISIKETTSVKLNKDAKEQAKLIFNELGITMGDAFNMFLIQKKGL